MKEKILNETTSYCGTCSNRECCLEMECILFRIEQILNSIKSDVDEK